MNTNYHIASSPRVSAFASSNSSSVITVRTSDRSFQSVGSTGPAGSGVPLGSFDAYKVKKTASFIDIHGDVSNSQSSLMPQPKLYTEGTGDGSSGERPGIDGTNGSNAGGQEYPMGDMLLPLLVMTMAYVVIKIFRNCKISKAL